MLHKVDFQLVLEELRHGLGHKLVGDGLFGLVLVAGAGGEAGGNQNQAVLHIVEGDEAFVFLVQTLIFQPVVDLVDKGQADSAVRAAAVLQPRRVVIVFQRLHRVGKAERHVHFDLIFRLIITVAADCGTGAEMHRGQGSLTGDLIGIVLNAMLIEIFDFFGTLARAVVEHESHTVIDNGLAAQHILEGIRRNIDVGKHIGVRFPADDGAGAAAGERLFFQPADILTFFEIQVIVHAIAVNIRSHPFAGILGGAKAKAVQAKGEVIVTATLAIFASRVQFAEHKIPVPAFFSFIVIDGDTAAKVLYFHRVIRVKGNVDFVAVAVTRFVDGVGYDLKNGMGTAFHTVRAKDNGRALAHTVCTF